MTDKIVNKMTDPFFRAPNRFWDDGHGAFLGAQTGFVFFALLRHSNTSHQCFPSYSCLQEETGLSRPSISKSIAKLIEFSYIRRLEMGSSRGKASVYEIMELPDLTSKRDLLVNDVNQLTRFTTLVNVVNQSLVNDVYSKKTNSKKTNEKDSFSERGKNPNEKVRSRHGEIRSLIAERVTDVESFLGWKANKLKTYSMYQDCNVSAAVVLQFYANKLPHWDAISGDSQAVANLIELIEADIIQFASPSKPTEAQKNDLEGIVPEYQNTPEILELNGEEFQRRFGVTQNKFKSYLFEKGLL